MSPFNVNERVPVFPGDVCVKRKDVSGMLWTTPVGVPAPQMERGRHIGLTTTCLVIGFFGEDAFVITSKGEQGYVRHAALKPISPR